MSTHCAHPARSTPLAEIVRKLGFAALIAVLPFAVAVPSAAQTCLQWEDMNLSGGDEIEDGDEFTLAGINVIFDIQILENEAGCGVTAQNGTFEPDLPTPFVHYGSGTLGAHTGYVGMRFDNENDDPCDVIEMRIGFEPGVEGLEFDLLDVDTGSWDDGVEILYGDGSSLTDLRGSSIVTDIAGCAGLDNETYMSGYEGWGCSVASSSTNGNFLFDFGSNTTHTLHLRYFSVDDANSNPGSQVIGLSDFCWDATTHSLIEDFSARQHEEGGLEISWKTNTELGTAGFRLLREGVEGEVVTINDHLLSSFPPAVQGASYRIHDEETRFSDRPVYYLEEVEVDGKTQRYGPYRPYVTVTRSPSPATSAGDRTLREPIYDDAPLEAAPPRKGTAAYFRARVATSRTGVHRISAADLAAVLGRSENQVRARIRTGRLSLQHQGKLVAWLPVGDGDAVDLWGFAPSLPFSVHEAQELRFHATGFSGSEASGGAPKPVALGSFRDTATFEQDNAPNTVASSDPRGDFWFWSSLREGVAGQDTLTHAFDLPGHVGGSTTLRVELKGLNETAPGDEHIVDVRVNGQLLGSPSLDGFALETFRFDVAPGVLTELGNTIELVARAASGAPASWTAVDSFAVDYDRAFRAANDAIELESLDSVLTVEGFSSSDINVYRVARNGSLTRITSPTIDADGSGGFRVSFANNDVIDGRYYVATTAALKTPELRPWRRATPGRGIDYLVIAPRLLEGGANALADYRAGRGSTTQVAFVNDIYDRYSFGNEDPHAIREMIRAVANRSEGVAVTLVGDGSLDYRDLGFPTPTGDNLVPVFLHATRQGLISSDNLFGDLDGDGTPEVGVGRIPSKNNDQVLTVLEKIQRFEASARGDNEHVVLLGDNADFAGDFARTLDQHVSLFEGLELERIELTAEAAELSERRAALFDALARGPAIVDYVGHGGFDRVTDEGLWMSADVPFLPTDVRSPILLALTCIVNRFEFPGFAFFGEVLAEAEGGAVAVWAPGGVSFDADAAALGRFFVEAIRSGEATRLGDAVAQAYQAFDDGRNLQDALLMTLLGDAGLEIPIGFLGDPVEELEPPTPDDGVGGGSEPDL